MGYGGFIGGFSRALLLSMNWLHDFFRLPYGWAIVTITLIVKLAFWPLTAAGTRSMKRMQALQPQMKAIADKYKDDPAKKNQKTMEFMKEHKVNPMSGCLPMLIQMPILWGFYRMIMSAIELRGAPFLWIGDLSQPDTLFIIPGLSFVPLIGIPGVGARQPAPAHHGRDAALAIASQPAVARHGSGAAKKDAVYAAHVPVRVLQYVLRFDALLDRVKSADRYANKADQRSDRMIRCGGASEKGKMNP